VEATGLLNHQLKKELEGLGTEVIAIREILRAEQRKENAMIN
jgi:hypothetical protein